MRRGFVENGMRPVAPCGASDDSLRVISFCHGDFQFCLSHRLPRGSGRRVLVGRTLPLREGAWRMVAAVPSLELRHHLRP